MPARELPCPARLLPDFHTRRTIARTCNSGSTPARHHENPCPACVLLDIASCACTKSGHPPVDGLHPTENKPDKGTHFLLTAKLEVVQRESFFDSFLSFSGWCSVRGSS
jgi:hypothetical protein